MVLLRVTMADRTHLVGKAPMARPKNSLAAQKPTFAADSGQKLMGQKADQRWGPRTRVVQSLR